MDVKKENMPHNGTLLEGYVKSSRETGTAISRQMGYSHSLIARLYDTPSIRTHIFWKLGLILNRNLLAELAEQFPIQHKSKREQELEAELESVQKELEIYKRIMEKR